MRSLSLILPSVFLILSLPTVYCQAQPNDCSNLGLELGTFHGWKAGYGTWSVDPANNAVVIESQANGFLPEQHRIRHKSEGNVPEITAEAVPLVPPGSDYAIQLGNSINGAQFEYLTTSFRVDADNTLFQYQFAVIFEDPNHDPVQQPRFELRVTDQQGNTLPCGYYQVTAAGDVEGFKSQGKIRYRDWTTAGVDLRDYVGQVVTLRISTFDCSKGGHWGMALFDASCLSTKIKPLNYCPGVDSVLTLEAPLGFRDYVWSTGAVGRTATVNNPTPGGTISVKFTPFSSLSDSCRLLLSFTVPTGPEVLPSSQAIFCEGSSAKIETDYHGENFKYRWQPSGDTSRVLVVDKPGTYVVQILKPGGCVLTDTIEMRTVIAPKVAIEFDNLSCDGINDGSVKAIVTAQEPISFRWNNGPDSSAALRNIPSGYYQVVVTGGVTGCTATAGHWLVQNDSVTANARLLRLPLCDNWPTGEATVVAAEGIPPYSYAWSTGAEQQNTALARGGTFRVTVTDADGCEAVDSVFVQPMRADTETEGNICHDGRTGAIEINAFGGTPPHRYALGNGSFGAASEFGQLPTGPYTYRVQDNNGCIRHFETEVKNLRSEPFRIQLPHDTSIVVGEYLDVNLWHNYPLGSVTWFGPCSDSLFDVTQATLRPLSYCSLSVAATDTFGCPATATLRVQVRKQYNLYIPNVFMPPNGHDNSTFYASVQVEQLKQIHSLRIFDRWGNLVLEDFDYQPNAVEQGWDGTTTGQEAPPGVYVYQFDIEFIDGYRQIFSGDVTLVR